MTELQHHSDEAMPAPRQETYLRFQVGSKLAEYLLSPLKQQARIAHTPVLYANIHHPISVSAANNPLNRWKASKIWPANAEQRLPVREIVMQLRKKHQEVAHLVAGDRIDIGLMVSPLNHEKILQTLGTFGAEGIASKPSDELNKLTPFVSFDYGELEGEDEESMDISRTKVQNLLRHRDAYNKSLGQYASAYFISPPAPKSC